MSLSDPVRPMPPRRLPVSRLLGLACAGLLAASTAGCFTPMYAETTPGQESGLEQSLSDVEVVFAQGRIGNEVRNDLIFGLTGGAGNPVGAPYKLMLNVTDSTAVSAVVNPVTGLPEVELVSVDVYWQLVDAGDPKIVLTQGHAYGKASLDSGYQRFARSRAIRDAQNRASRVASDTVKSQVASYFVTRAAAPHAAAPKS